LSTLTLPRILFSVVLFFGVLLTFVIPPLQTPDEDAHLIRTVMVSEGRFGASPVDGCQDGVPTSLVMFTNQTDDLKGKTDHRFNYSKWFQQSFANEDKAQRGHDCYAAEGVSPLLYIPPAVGLLAGRVIYKISPLKEQKFDWSAAAYFSRLGNILALAIGAAVACAWASRFGAIIFAVATMPMTLQAGASSNYDVTTIVSCLLFFALVVRILSRGSQPTRLELFGLLATGFFVAHSKIVYSPLLLLVFTLRRVTPSRTFIGLCAALALAAALGVILGASGVAASAEQKALQHQQVAFIAGHPLQMGRIILDTLHAHRDSYTVSYLGQFGWLDTYMPLGASMLVWAMLGCALVGDALKGPNPLGWLGSTTAVVAALGSVVGVMLVLYVAWTAKTAGVGAATIEGVQGRYFLPVTATILAAIAVSPRWVADRAEQARLNLLQAQVTISAAVLSVMTFTILLRFWLPQPPA
jgi:uncharacterized membrane protein